MRCRPLILLLIAMCVACGRQETPAPATTSTTTVVDDTTPRDGGTLYRRLDLDVVTLNPVLSASRYDRYVANALFTPIVQLDKNLEPVPGLADSWDVSDDGLIYTFDLNEKATFSDGQPVRASDVVFTLRKIADPSSGAAQIAGSFEFIDLSKTRAVDDHTVEVAFTQPLAGQLLRFNDVLVVPEHVYGRGDFKRDFNEKAVGSGPYLLVRRVPGREVVLRRRPDYWGRKPHIENVVMKVINDHATAFNALKLGQIDETIVASDTWLREKNNPELSGRIDFQRFYTLNYNYIAWNNRNPLLSDKRVRRALSMCIPVESVIRDLYHDTARAMTGPFTPDQWAYNPNVPAIRFDPAGARQLFAAAGWADHDHDGTIDKGGRPFKLSFLIMSGSATAQQIAQMLQSELKKQGVQLDILMLDGATAIPRIAAGNYDAAYLSWDLDPDPDPYALFHSSQMPPHGQNWVFYSNPVADQLMDQARHELDQSKRKDLYWKLHEVLAEDQPYTWIVQVSVKWAINKRVRNVQVSRGFGLFLWYPGELEWWLADDARSGASRGAAGGQ